MNKLLFKDPNAVIEEPLIQVPQIMALGKREPRCDSNPCPWGLP